MYAIAFLLCVGAFVLGVFFGAFLMCGNCFDLEGD